MMHYTYIIRLISSPDQTYIGSAIRVHGDRMYRPLINLCLIVVFLSLPLVVTGKDYRTFIDSAKKAHGAWGERAAKFLVAHMPEQDREKLEVSFLVEHLDYAARAREAFPWAKAVPEAIYFNDVLPYAVFDEPRDPWRAELYPIAARLVRGAKTASEAAQILNRDFFNTIETHYSRERQRANQSPKESMEQGKASCTGLSILLVAACRSVGIPARAVGTPMWWNNSGNHTWVEIWDGEWYFTGADEYNPKGLNHAWFVKNAARADLNDPHKAIYATSWKRSGLHFPMVWSPESTTVAAIHVTERYASQAGENGQGIGIRLLDGSQRVQAKGWLTKVSGFPIQEFMTKAGRTDYNDARRVELMEGEHYRWKFLINGQYLESAAFAYKASSPDILDLQLQALQPAPDFTQPTRALSKAEAERAIDYVIDEILAELKADDHEGYVHQTRIHQKMGHSMNRNDAETFQRIQQFSHNPWPRKIVWHQEDVTHDRFYWLQLPEGAAKKGQTIQAELKGRTIHLSRDVPKGMRVLLSDALLDLDQPVEIHVEGRDPIRVTPTRTLGAIRESLEARLDKHSAYSASAGCSF
ncbi:MAG: transglutaminase-like domain-containing protein [Opitutales bacterium]